MTLQIDQAPRRRGRLSNAEIAAREEARREEERHIIGSVPTPRRFVMADLDAWMLERLIHRRGGTEAYWRGYLPSVIASNDSLFITNGEAVLLATVLRLPTVMKPIAFEVFAFARAADCRDDVYNVDTLYERHLRRLYQQMLEWAKGLGAVARIGGLGSDILPHRLKELMGSDAYYLVGAPC